VGVALPLICALSVSAPSPCCNTRLRSPTVDPNGVPEYRRIAFPVQEAVTYTDSFGDCRSGCTRRHEGQDLIGQRLLHERAAVDGTVAYMKTTGDGTGGNWLEIRDSQGWYYKLRAHQQRHARDRRRARTRLRIALLPGSCPART